MPGHGRVAVSTGSSTDRSNHDQLSDEELTAIFVDEAQAFVVLYRRYVDRVFSYFAWRFGWSDAEDLTADVFTRALKARTGFKRGKAWRPWLFGIARNRALEHSRYRGRNGPLAKMSNDEESVPGPAAEVEAAERAQAVRMAVSELSDSQREIVELRFWAGLSYREVAEILGGTEGSLRVQVHRILRTLKAQVEVER